MCAVFASVGEGLSVDELKSTIELMNHRGPDEDSVYVDGEVILAHRRLSVRDLVGGQQPFSKAGVSVIANGELYEYQEIRRRLEARGCEFKSWSDNELLLHLYLEYDLGLFEHLRGEFAFILWDKDRDLLLAARDRFGIKPLYYRDLSLDPHTERKGLRVASEAKALNPTAWDLDSFYTVMSCQYLYPDQSLFQGIKQVPPGHYLTYHDHTHQLHEYWDMNFPVDKVEVSSSELLDALHESIRLRLNADVPLCFHLSGGIDSTTIATLAAQYQSDVHCFTVSFPHDQRYDELHLAQQSAAHIGATHHVVSLSDRALLESLEESVYFSEGIGINAHLPSKFLLNKAIKEAGFKVSLSGEGADEVLGGYPHFLQDLNPDRQEQIFSGHVVAQGVMIGAGESLPLSLPLHHPFTPSYFKAKASMGHKLHSLLDDDFLTAHAHRDCYAEQLDRVEERLRGANILDRSTYLWTESALAQYILRTLGDGCEMAHSVEGRLPFLDHKLFELCKKMKTTQKIKGLTEKYILKESVRGLIPDVIYRRKKHPFIAPPICTNPSNFDFVNDHIQQAPLPFSSAKINSLLSRISGMSAPERKAWDPILFTVLSCLFLDQRILSSNTTLNNRSNV